MEIISKLKQFKRKFRKNAIIKGFIIFYIAGIIMFFTSKSWYPDNADDYVQPTVIGNTVTFADRDFTLKRWEYSETQQIMEIEFQMLDHSTDGIKSLYYEAMDIKKGLLNTEVVYEENNLTIIRIKDIPEKWSQISFRIKLSKDDDKVLKYYTNKEAVAKVSKIKDRTQNQYFIDRAKKDIENLEKQMEQNKELIAQYEERINAANGNISELMASKKYQTEEEQLTTDSIKQLEEDIIAYQKVIAELDVEIQDYDTKIEKSREQISEYQKNE